MRKWAVVCIAFGVLIVPGLSWATCSTQDKKIVVWAPNWFEDSTVGGCDEAKLITTVWNLAVDLYGDHGLTANHINVRHDVYFDGEGLDLNQLEAFLSGSNTKTLYLLGHGTSEVFFASEVEFEVECWAEYARLIDAGWDSTYIRPGRVLEGAFRPYGVGLTLEGIQAKIAPALSDGAMVLAIYCLSGWHYWAYGLSGKPEATFVGYYGWPSLGSSCTDLENATGSLLCAFWDDAGNELDDYDKWRGYISGWSIVGNAANQLVCGVGCQNLAALVDHVEAFDGAVFWTAQFLQSESHFIVRGYRWRGSKPDELARIDGGGRPSVGTMRTFSTPVPRGYVAFDVVEIDDAGRRTVSYPPADYGRRSGFWDQWAPNRDYGGSDITVARREERSHRIATGIGVRSALSFISSDPEWVRRFNGGLEQTHRRAKASKFSDIWGEITTAGPSAIDTSREAETTPSIEDYRADAILWAYDPWMIPDMVAHLESFVTRDGDPLDVRWFSGDPTLSSVHEAVQLVLEANARYGGPRTYPARPPLWFVGEAGWISWPPEVEGTCVQGDSTSGYYCCGYRRFYPGEGRKPVVVVPTDSLGLMQRQITGTEEWNAGTSVNPDGRVICLIGDLTSEGSSWFMQDMFSNVDEAFAASGRPVDFYYESEYEGSSGPEFLEVGYDAINGGAQYFFESAVLHNVNRWSLFVFDPDVSALTTEQRTFWIVSSCQGSGFHVARPIKVGRELLYNDLDRTTAVGVLGQMNGAFEAPYRMYIEYVLDAMVAASADTLPAPWWSIAEDAAQGMLGDHGEELGIADFVDGLVLYAANPMLEPGTVLVSPYAEAEIESYVRKCGDDTLLAWQDATAVGCPQGDRDQIVISVAIDERDVIGPVPADKITIGQPSDSNIVFYGPLTADSAATLLDGFYRTTITVESFGADTCGVDSAVVRLYNIDLGHARTQAKSFDIQTSGATRGKVDLPDLAIFANHFPSGYAPYWSCVDYVPADTVVDLGDFSLFVSHWEHSYPDSGPALAQTVGAASGTVTLGFEEDNPLVGPRMLRASVRLSDIEPFRVMFLSFKNENSMFRFHGWQQDGDFRGRTGCVDVVRDGQKEIVVVAVGPKEQESRSVELGYFELEILAEEPLQLTEDDFSLQAADVLSLGGRALAFGTSQVERSVEPAVFRNELAQNYPNPFNPTTTIAFSVAMDSNVELAIYDVTGARVRTLVREHRRANNYREVWDGRSDRGSDVASGVYFYRLTAGAFTNTKKMVLLR